MTAAAENQLALSIGLAVLEAIKAYEPEKVVVEQEAARYMTARQLIEVYGRCQKTIRTLIDEIRGQIAIGRYPEESVLEGCGVMVSVDVFNDYLAHRKALKDPVACKYVPKYAAPAWREGERES